MNKAPSLTQLRKEVKELEAKNPEIYAIASCIPLCEGTGSFDDDEYDQLLSIIDLFNDIEERDKLIKERTISEIKNNIDSKIEKLMDLSIGFIFIEHYSHTNQPMYKILNPYTHYREDKLVLCPVSEGIEKAIDLAYEHIKQKREDFFDNK
jgi:hypothetical protein